MFRSDPGACAICGAAHTACTADPGPIRVEQLPATAAAREAAAEAVVTPPLVAEIVQAGLPEGAFTTATYQRKKKPRP